MESMKKRCMGCMSMIDDVAVCPICGFVQKAGGNNKAIVPGTILEDKYIIGKCLGEGGFGITYLGWDMALGMRVAIKEYYPSGIVTREITGSESTVRLMSQTDYDNYQSGLSRYVKEANILSKFFNLSGIVCVKDFFYANQTAYIVMEYIDGISLKDYLKQRGGRLSVEETLELMKPIISSLDIVHKNHLLHRDISPDNIMISKDGIVKLIDFGAARYFDADSEKSMTVVLKHGYAPVEQYSRKGDCGEWTDIYSLCATMYRMVTGESPVESLDRIHQDRLVPIGNYKKIKVPKYFAAAITKGLSVQPHDRQQNLYELYIQLYEHESVKSKEKSKILLSLMLIVLVLLLFVVLIGGLVLYNNQKAKEISQTIEEIDIEETDTEKDDTGNSYTEPVQKASKEEKSKDIKEDRAEETEPESSQDTEKAEVAIFSHMSESISSGTEYQITIARDGFLHTVGESYTVGEILNMYSDSQGVWTATDFDYSDTAYVYYTGMKDGVTFTVEFEVNRNNQFMITGAAKESQALSDYNSFIQEILKETGV